MHQSRRDASPFNTTVDDGVRLVVAADRLAGSAAARSLGLGQTLSLSLSLTLTLALALTLTLT